MQDALAQVNKYPRSSQQVDGHHNIPDTPPMLTGTSTVPIVFARPPIPRASVTLPFQCPRSPCFLSASKRRSKAVLPTRP